MVGTPHLDFKDLENNTVYLGDRLEMLMLIIIMIMMIFLFLRF